MQKQRLHCYTVTLKLAALLQSFAPHPGVVATAVKLSIPVALLLRHVTAA